MTDDEQTTGPVWRDRGTIIANQQARIAELEAACQRLRDDHQGALAERDEARAEVEASAAGFLDAINLLTIRLTKAADRARAAEADAAGLWARIEALCDDTSRHLVRWIDDSHLVDVSDVRAALAAEPTPAATVQADAWDEGFEAGCQYRESSGYVGHMGPSDPPLNPYDREPTPASDGLRVQIDRIDGQPATCKVWAGEVLRFDGIDRSALLREPTPAAEPHAEDGA